MEKMDECSSSSSIDMEPTVFDRESASGINSGYNMDSAKEARDEVKEIERVSSKETTIIHAWRIFLMFFLFFTAMLVSSLTYFRLVGYEKSSYEIAFSSLSESIGEGVITRHKNIQEAIKTLANSITAAATASVEEWPFFLLPSAEPQFADTIERTGFEEIAFFTKVPGHLRTEYVDWYSEQYYNFFSEAHLFHYGTLDRVPSNVTYNADITTISQDGFVPDITRQNYYAASHWSRPPLTFDILNWNPYGVPDFAAIIEAGEKVGNKSLYTKVYTDVSGKVSLTHEEHELLHTSGAGNQPNQPHSYVFHPITKAFDKDHADIVGHLVAEFAWDILFKDLLVEVVKEDIDVVLHNNCNQSFTYVLNSGDVVYRGTGDLHDGYFNRMKTTFNLSESKRTPEISEGHCMYVIDVYPTEAFGRSFESGKPETYAFIIAGTFFLVLLTFLVYDVFVQKRNKKLVENAAKSGAILTSLFPSNVRDRLIRQEDQTKKSKSGVGVPIADLFLESTVLFADIVGFTAWSSVREPSQVFVLLETLFSAFDTIANDRGVFKVETVGDCYVAATGIPTPRRDHAVSMVRFARDIVHKMGYLVRELEVSLGPDTGDLGLRVGIHSGPVTGGVLRGQRSRFQLFGDTMNTAARIESSGCRGRIHLSSDTAELLIRDGKAHWIEKREDLISAKGKGSLQTYYVKKQISKQRRSGSNHESESDEQSSAPEFSESDFEGSSGFTADKNKRLIDWNTETLLQLLRQVAARRSDKVVPDSPCHLDMIGKNQSTLPLEEVKEIIRLPEYDAEAVKFHSSFELGEAAKHQVRDYVSCIAGMYRNNAFHNFEHASHVTMSVNKLLSRIVAPKGVQGDDDALHDHTYGITSDPLTQFACSFSALIHDVDHTGVPNTQLVKENLAIATVYKKRSVAEQNSLMLSWNLLMDERFADFRAVLFQTEKELIRFRQLVVNIVMATDIADKDLKALRNARWAKAFDEEAGGVLSSQLPTKDDVDRKATIVIEHLIQASDISHTMQHWHVYRKWNERLFTELYQAYIDGRAETDPSTFWYKGELGFFDFYIIPLTKKLKECGVFGISSDEYLNYALKNRREWEDKGQQVVAEMMSKIPRSLKTNTGTSRRSSQRG